MSHIVQIQTEVRDPAAAAAACRRLGLPEPEIGVAKLFEGEAQGLLVRLPGWLYPVVCDLATGTLKYDNYGGAWGDPARLDNFQQRYAVEKATIEARRKGYGVTEHALADGSVRLIVRVGDAAGPRRSRRSTTPASRPATTCPSRTDGTRRTPPHYPRTLHDRGGRP